MGARRVRAAFAGAAHAGSEVLGTYLRKSLADQAAIRNDQIERARIADEGVSSGKLTPEQGAALKAGHAIEPSVQQDLAKITGPIQKASSVNELPTRSGLAADLRAARVPLIGFGVMGGQTGEPPAAGDSAPMADALLPSRQFGPTESPELSGLLQTRGEKLRSFAPTKIGSEMQGQGDLAQNVDIFGKWNPDTGQMDRTGTTPAGPTAGQKGGFEGTAAATSERLQRPEKIQTAVQTETATRAGKVQTASQEAYARKMADLQADLQRASQTGGMLPEQRTSALALGDDFAKQSAPFWVVQDSFRRMATAASDPSPAGDMAIIFSYMKVLDPNSSVREGEYATAAQAGSIPTRLINMYNGLLNGEKIAVNRDDFLHQGANIYKSAVAEHQQRVQDYSVRAKQFGVDPTIIIRQPAGDLMRGNQTVGDTFMLGGKKVRITGFMPDGRIDTEVVLK